MREEVAAIGFGRRDCGNGGVWFEGFEQLREGTKVFEGARGRTHQIEWSWY